MNHYTLIKKKILESLIDMVDGESESQDNFKPWKEKMSFLLILLIKLKIFLNGNLYDNKKRIEPN